MHRNLNIENIKIILPYIGDEKKNKKYLKEC